MQQLLGQDLCAVCGHVFARELDCPSCGHPRDKVSSKHCLNGYSIPVRALENYFRSKGYGDVPVPGGNKPIKNPLLDALEQQGLLTARDIEEINQLARGGRGRSDEAPAHGRDDDD